MKPFSYEVARDVGSAVDTVARDRGAQFIAGGTSQVDLMKEGVQQPTRLRDLAALREGITALALAELGHRISLGIAGRSGRVALRGLAEAHRTFARESPGRWQSLHRRAGASAVDSGAARTVVALTDAVLRGYGLAPAERVHATRLIGSTIAGYLMLEQIGSFEHSRPASEVSWQKTLDALDGVFHAWPTES